MTTTPLVWKAESQANTTTTGTQSNSQVIGLDDDGYVVIWNDTSGVFSTGTAVVGQRFDAQGVKVGGEHPVSGFANGVDAVVDGASITNLHNGNIAVAYSDTFSGDADVYVRVDNASLGFVRNDAIDTDDTLQTKNAAITSFADGSYVVSYTLDNGSGNTDILARLVSPTGVVGAPITVRDNGTQDADLSQLATLSNGNFVDVYQQNKQIIGSDHDIYFSIYTHVGAVVVNNMAVAGAIDNTEEFDPDVVALAGGGFVVAWFDNNSDGPGNPGVRATIYNNSGGVVAGDFALNTTTANPQVDVSLVALAHGGFVAIWEDEFAGVDRGQRFDALGHKVGTEFVVKTNPFASPVDSPDLALLNDGRLVATFSDLSPPGPDSNITNTIFDPRTLHENFDGIHHSDFLWQHDSGQAAVWLLDDTTPTGAAAVGSNPGPTWHLLGNGDFNQDGRSDFLWQNDSGQAAVWLMDGTTPIGAATVGPNPGPTWHVKDSGDFNGDGKDDILWQNDSGQAAIWLLNGTTPIGAGTVGANPGPGWHIKASGDFNGDGHDDILWQHDSGQAAIWLMNGTTPIGAATVGANPGPSWHVIDAGDFNGDGKDDILWQHDSGQAAIWLMNGTTPIGAGTVGANPGPTWHVQGAAQFNGDGKSDIVWQNDNGQAAVWIIDGLNPVAGVAVGTNPGPDWHLVV